MKYLKTFEKHEEYEDFKEGDTVYCIDNNDCECQLEIGNKYKINNKVIYNSRLINISNSKMGLGFYRKIRFTKNPNHPKILDFIAKKYNL